MISFAVDHLAVIRLEVLNIHFREFSASTHLANRRASLVFESNRENFLT